MLHFKLILAFFYLFLYVHITACLWSLMTPFEEDWYPPLEIVAKSVYSESGHLMDRYVIALYYSTIMLLGADAFPRGVLQQLFASCVSLIGAIVIAILFGNMTVLMDNLRVKAKLLEEEIDTANHVMSTLGIPTALQTKVLEYILKTFRTKDKQQELNRFLLLLSPSLKYYLSQYLFTSALKLNPVFKGHDTLIESLSHYIHINGCNPETVLTHTSQPGHAFHILAIGEVSVSTHNLDGFPRVVRTLKTGDFFGEIALLTDSKCTATVTALNFCTYGVIIPTSFEALIASFPAFRESLLMHIIQVYSDEERSLVVERLKQLAFIDSLTEAEKLLLFYSLQPVFYGKTQVIYTRGQSVSDLIVVVSGKLSIQMHLKRREITGKMGNLPVGSLCFCASFLSGVPLVADVVALEPTVAFSLNNQVLDSMR